MHEQQMLLRVFLPLSAVAFAAFGVPAQYTLAENAPGQPRLVSEEVLPVYPQEAYDAKQEGSVKLGFDIKEDGTPTNIKVLEKTGPDSLRERAVEVLQFSRYLPVIGGRKQPTTGLTRTFDFKLADAILSPKPITISKPIWPSNISTRISGYCDVNFIVEPDGSTSRATVTSSAPYQVFDDACLGAVRLWKYQPATQDGKPVAAPQFFRFNFDGNDVAPSYLGPGQWVTLRYVLKKDGTPADVEVVAQSDPDVFVGKARRQLLQMHFKPDMEDGVPVDKPNQTITIKGPTK